VAQVGLLRINTKVFFLVHAGGMVEDAGSFIFFNETNLPVDWLRPVTVSIPPSVDPGWAFLY
jgi:hypothetical protein